MASKVVASCDIPEGAVSSPGIGPIDLRRLFDSTVPTVVFHADVQDNCLQIAECHADKDWARFIAIARNCHEQNVEITNTRLGLILRTIKPIKANDELFVWIGRDLLSNLEFPFLKPSNIIGNQAYHCHKCGTVFEDPNPLKVHLSFVCRSKESLDYSPISKPWSCGPSCDIIKSNRSASTISPLSNTDGHTFQQLVYPLSDVFPDKNIHRNNETMNKSKTFTDAEVSVQETTTEPNLKFVAPISWHNWESDMKPNFSHMSQGHTCAFCGKIYSRKYGLKIHVRTHTGYKPLKCKYCFRPFSDPSNLNKHVRLHSESDAPYRCLKCGKVLVRRRDFDRHMKSRHPDEHVE